MAVGVPFQRHEYGSYYFFFGITRFSKLFTAVILPCFLKWFTWPLPSVLPQVSLYDLYILSTSLSSISVLLSICCIVLYFSVVHVGDNFLLPCHLGCCRSLSLSLPNRLLKVAFPKICIYTIVLYCQILTSYNFMSVTNLLLFFYRWSCWLNTGDSWERTFFLCYCSTGNIKELKNVYLFNTNIKVFFFFCKLYSILFICDVFWWNIFGVYLVSTIKGYFTFATYSRKK